MLRSDQQRERREEAVVRILLLSIAIVTLGVVWLLSLLVTR